MDDGHEPHDAPDAGRVLGALRVEERAGPRDPGRGDGRTVPARRRANFEKTHVAPAATETVSHDGETYRGWRYPEHRPGDDEPTRRARLLASLSNETSFWLAPESLVALLRRVGFPAVLRCHAPLQPFQGEDRLTLLALKGGAPAIVSYSWIKGASEDEVRRRSARPIRLAPPGGSAREEAVIAVLIALGGWTRGRPGFVLGTGRAAGWIHAGERPPDAAIWRRADLGAAVGGLCAVPPLLAIEIAGPEEGEEDLLEKATGHLGAGAGAVWLVRPEAGQVTVVTSSGAARLGAGEVLPEPPGLPGLSPHAADLLPPAVDCR